MDLVDIGHRPVTFGEIGDLADGGDVAVHGIEALEDDQLGARRIRGGEQLFEMGHVVVAENDLVATRTAHPFNHGIVIEGVGEDQTIGH